MTQPQNLVPNASFEQKTNFNQISSDPNWVKCLKNDTPDYIEFTNRGEPDFYYRSYIGGLLPYDGEAYIGIFCYRTNELRGIENVREFIQIPLREKLKKDTLYRVSLAIALDTESTSAIRNFNVYFSPEPLNLKREKQMFKLSPQIRFQDDFFESEKWIEIAALYKARGFEKQLILGNFLADSRTRKKSVSFESSMQEKWDLHELEKAAYYYIDMVAVIKNSEWLARIIPKEIPDISILIADLPQPDIGNDSLYKSKPVNINEVKIDSSVTLNNIFFEFDESELLAASHLELDSLYSQLDVFKNLSIVIEGHTDNMGTFEYNMSLSLRRAHAVVDYLTKKGLSEKRITYEGFGYTMPLSDNRDEIGRSFNRRVAFRILERKMK